MFNLRGVKLDYRARADIPIFMAARGEQSIKACGEFADGMLVSNMCTAAFVAKAVAILHDAARGAGRTATPAVVQYMPCHVRPIGARRSRAAKRAVAEMLPAYWRARPAAAGREDRIDRRQRHCGGGDSPRAVTRLKAGEPASAVLDDRYVAAFTIAGNAQDCRAQAEVYGRAQASPSLR